MLFSLLFIALVLLVCPLKIHSEKESFSFYRFSGPVSGESQEILINGPFGQRMGYVARPDYSFHYGVQDAETGNSQTHKESRDGNKVIGEYRVLQDDGIVRIVRYTADAEHGFQPHIEYKRLRDRFR